MILNFIKDIYHKHSDLKLFVFLNDLYMNGFWVKNMIAHYKIKRMAKEKKKADLPIRVLFICSDVYVWNKTSCVFEAMLRDERFLPVIVVAGKNEAENAYTYWKNLYGESVKDGMRPDTILNIKEWQPDYVFYQEPYDQYLPRQYRSDEVSKFAKICYIGYCYALSEAIMKIVLEKKFFRNVYLYFAENSYVAEYNIGRFKKEHEKGYRKTLDIGYPDFENFFSKKTEADNEKFTIIWTPRWSDNSNIGGSNFLKYKDDIVDFSKNNENVKIIFRPHPMTFEHFVSVGKMTQKDVDEYLLNYNNERRKVDSSADYAETFWKSDVLVTDYSSVFVPYFLTGKPIIYCDTGVDLIPPVQKMKEVFYNPTDWGEVEKIIVQLSEGIDPLKELRKERIKELFGGNYEHVSERFLDAIYADYVERLV